MSCMDDDAKEHFEGDETNSLLAETLTKRGFTLSSAESCTGGNIAHLITLRAGASEYFKGGVVSYTNEIKENILGVPHEVIERYGVVSEEVAIAMARGVKERFKTTCSISTTGVAGPTGGTPQTPVGTVWMAAFIGEKYKTLCEHFSGEREEIIQKATLKALLLLQNLLE